MKSKSNPRAVGFLLLAAVLSAAGLPSAANAADERPNIILFMADDVGFEGISCYGSTTYQTPRLDRLAAGGMRFEHCYSQPICTPSRVKIMTGRRNWRNYTDFGELGRGEGTFGNLLRDHGYRTGVVGKWQLGGDAETVRSFGFDEHCLWHIGGRESRYWNPRLVRNGEVMEGLESRFGPDVLCEFALEFIRRPSDKPFFLYYPMVLPHWPFIPTPNSAPGKGRERSGRYDGQAGGTQYFPDMVAYFDEIVGRVADQLDAAGLSDNTLLLFTGDNGCATNIRSEWKGRTIEGGKGRMTDAGTHVALIAHWPDAIAPGQVSDALVEFSDFLPTIAEAAGADVPARWEIDGKSFLPVLRGEAPSTRDWILCHYQRNALPREPADSDQRGALLRRQLEMRDAKQLGRFARDRRYKLYDDGRFYDIASDPLERTPIAHGQESEEAAAARRTLQAAHDGLPKWAPFRPR